MDPNTLNLDPDPGLYIHIFQSVEVSYIFHLLPLLYNIFTCADPNPDPQSAWIRIQTGSRSTTLIWQHILMRSLFNLFNVCLSQKFNIIFLVLPGKTWSEIMQNVRAFLNLHFIGRVRFQSIMEFFGIFFWWGGGGSNYNLSSSEISVDEEIG